MTRRSHSSGFTLMEVLVALVIVALSLAAVGTTTLQSVENGQAMRDRTYASWIAQNQITELRLSPQQPKLGASNGEVEYANAEWAWRAVVAETGVDELWRVDVTVSFPGSEYDIRTVTGFIGSPMSPMAPNSLGTIRTAQPTGNNTR